MFDDNETEEERPEFFAIQVSLMNCTPGNYDHAEGDPASIVTIARKDTIEPLVFSMDDTKALVTKLLVSLATYDDTFAQKLLDDNFSADDDGNFVYPEAELDGD